MVCCDCCVSLFVLGDRKKKKKGDLFVIDYKEKTFAIFH